jgi:uncharacterized protein
MNRLLLSSICAAVACLSPLVMIPDSQAAEPKLSNQTRVNRQSITERLLREFVRNFEAKKVQEVRNQLLAAQTKPTPSTSEQLVRQFFQRAQAEDIEQLIVLLTDDAVLNLKFPTPGAPNQIQGIDALRAYFTGGFRLFSRIGFSSINFYQTIDPSRVVVEAQGDYIVAATGTPYRNTFIFVIETNGRQIKTIREYFNPLIVFEQLQGINVNSLIPPQSPPPQSP